MGLLTIGMLSLIGFERCHGCCLKEGYLPTIDEAQLYDIVSFVISFC